MTKSKLWSVFAYIVTLLMIAQSFSPMIAAQNEDLIPLTDNTVVTDVEPEPDTDAGNSELTGTSSDENAEEATDTGSNETPSQDNGSETPEQPVIPEPTLVVLVDLQPYVVDATCEVPGASLNLEPVRQRYQGQIVSIDLEPGSVVVPGGTATVKVLFAENHALDQVNSFHEWTPGPGENEARITVEFAAAPDAYDCAVKVTLPSPVVVSGEEGSTPSVDLASIAELEGVSAVEVEGDVVAGNDVVVRVTLAEGFALDRETNQGWILQDDGSATFLLSIALDDDASEEDVQEPIGVALPAPQQVEGETGPEVDVSGVEAVEGVDTVTVEGDSEVQVEVTFEEGAELDEVNSDEGWESTGEGTAVYSLTLRSRAQPAAINPAESGITNAVVTPETLPDVLDPVRIDMNWTAVGAPNLTAGDSVTFTIANYELLGIGEITADDPIYLEGCGAGGTQCGYVIIDAAGNGTVILNENVNGAQSASGEFWIQTDPAWAEDLQEDEDRTIDFDVISRETTYPISVTIPAAPFVPTPTPEPSPEPGTDPYKSGWFNSRDQGRTEPNRSITWEMRAPTGPSAGATLTDTISADAGWVFDCSTVSFINDNGGQVDISLVECDELSLTVEIGPYLQSNPDNTPGIRVQASITDPANAADPSDGSLTFENVVTSTNLNWDGEEFGSGEADDDITQHGPGPGQGDEANPRKSGRFVDTTDQGRQNPVGAIEWTVRAPAGPADGVVLIDEAEEGWEFVCDPTLFSGGNWAGGHAATAELISCTPERVEVEFGAYREFNAGQTPGFTIRATRTAEQPANERAVLTFENTVTSFLTPWGGGDVIEGDAETSITQTVPPVPVLDGSKSGRFTRRDNGQFNPTNALEWTISFPPGPNGGVILVDSSVPVGDGVQMWAFDCSTVSLSSGPATDPDNIECGPDNLTITYPNGYGAGEQPVYTVRVNLLVPFEEGQIFTNEATFVVTDYVNDPDWSEDGTNEGSASGQIIQNRSQGGTGEIGEFAVSVGDYVWFDANRDGLQGDDEPGIGGVTVDLYGETTPGSGEYEFIGSTTTNGDGYYWFVDLQSDRNYYLQFTEPTELSDGTPLGGWTVQGDGSQQGSEGPWAGDDSNVDGSGLVYFTAPTMGANQPGAGETDNPTLDAGVVLPLVSIGDYVWFDYDRDGVQGTHELEEPVAGVTVTITGPDGFEATTTTDENGYYFFDDLEPSTTYDLVFEMPDGYDGWTIQGAGEDEALDSNVNAEGQTSVTTPASGSNLTAPGEADDPTIDAGLVRLVSIGDYVFIDENLDGIQDAGDTPIGGVTVTLIDAEGNERTTTTDVDGYYYFDNLQPGEPYTLVFEKPDGFEWTTQNAGDDDSIDSDVDPAGTIEFTAPLFGANLTGPDETDNPTLDAGVVRLVSIGDYVWFDYDRDGIQGSHELEEPVAGVTVTLYDADGTVVGTTTTDENGFYSFNNLLPDTDYYLIFDQPEDFDGWTLQDQGEDDAVDSDVDPATGRVDFTSPATGGNSLTAPDDPTLDAGLIVSYVSVGDFVWYDTNLDGVQDDDEAPAAGITVTLYDADGNVVGTTVTDENGYYWFNDLTPLADYTLEFEAPENYIWTLQDQGDDDAADSDVDRVTGRVSFTADEFGYNLPFGDDNGALVTDNPTLDAGLVQLVSIGDYVWFDYDRDGVQGTHELEEPVAGVTVTLYDADGVFVAETTTDENGFYSFNNLYPGTEYSLEFEQPERFDGWTLQDAGDDDAVDSDVDAEGRVTFTSPTSGENSLVTPDDPTLDAGLIITRVSVGDYVWWDENRDGVQDEGEEPVAGVVVTLYDSEGEVVGTTTTDENGYYYFNDLEPLGEYTIVFEKPDGFAGWTTQFEGDESSDSNVDESGEYSFTAPEFGANLTGPNETDDPTIDAGLIRLVSIGDYVWYDANRDGAQGEDEVPVAGVVVTLYASEGEVVGTTTTDENGYYFFQDLLPETEYRLVFEQPEDYTGWTQQDAGDNDAIDSDVNAEGVITFVSPATGNNLVGPDETDNPTLDAGLVRLISIGDYVWYDANRDGVQDEDEEPVAGVVVTLYDSEGEVVGTTTTDENGYYYFQDLYPDSDYTLEFERPEDYTEWTAQDAGDDDAADSDVDSNGRVSFTTPSTGNNLIGPDEADDPTLDAGLVRLVSVGDYVWYDEDRDGTQDPNEVPIAGVTVTITGPDGFTATTTTDENGYYYFQDLYPETEYTITFEKPDGYTEWTVRGEGSDRSVDSNVDADGTYTFTTPVSGSNQIGPGEPDDPTIDAGVVIKVSVGDYVWYDNDGDGIQDEDEKPASGIKVHLYRGTELVGSTTTDENGYYYFKDLFPNTEYTIVFEKPDGYEWTEQGAGNDPASDSNADPFGVVRFTTPATGENLIGPDATDLPTLDAGLVEKVDPVTPDPEKKPEPVKELPSTGVGSESNALSFAIASVFGLMAAAVALRMNAYKRS